MQSFFHQLAATVIGGLILLFFNGWYKTNDIDIKLFCIIIVLMTAYLSRNFLLSLGGTMIRRFMDYRPPSFKEILERSRQGFLEDKVFNISLLWASTWFIGVMTPIFLLIPYRERVAIPAEVLPTITVASITPVAMVMAVGVLRMMWQDWKRSNTRKQKIFWGIRNSVIIAITVTMVLLGQ